VILKGLTAFNKFPKIMPRRTGFAAEAIAEEYR